MVIKKIFNKRQKDNIFILSFILLCTVGFFVVMTNKNPYQASGLLIFLFIIELIVYYFLNLMSEPDYRVEVTEDIWYAWRPVTIQTFDVDRGNRIVWLEKVKRKKHFTTKNTDKWWTIITYYPLKEE